MKFTNKITMVQIPDHKPKYRYLAILIPTDKNSFFWEWSMDNLRKAIPNPRFTVDRDFNFVWMSHHGVPMGYDYSLKDAKVDLKKTVKMSVFPSNFKKFKKNLRFLTKTS